MTSISSISCNFATSFLVQEFIASPSRWDQTWQQLGHLDVPPGLRKCNDTCQVFFFISSNSDGTSSRWSSGSKYVYTYSLKDSMQIANLWDFEPWFTCKHQHWGKILNHPHHVNETTHIIMYTLLLDSTINIIYLVCFLTFCLHLAWRIITVLICSE